MAGDESKPGQDLDRRLKELSDRIDKTRQTKADRQARNPKSDTQGMGQAFRLSSEFIAAILVGSLLGYGIDAFFGVAPFGLISFFLLGFAAGILNVLRAAGTIAESPLRSSGNGQKDDPARNGDNTS